MAMSLRVVVPPHPLIANWLTLLRDRHTPDPLFATAMAELGRWLSYEAIRDWLPQRDVDVETPLSRSRGTIVDPEVPVLAVPILPAGLGLWQGGQPVLPGARVALLAPAPRGGGWALDTLPDAIGARVGVLVYAPVVASGRTLLAVLERLRGLGVEGPRLRVITSVAAAPGLKLIGERVADLTLYCSCIDGELDGEGRLLPGFGDPERRLHGIGTTACLG